MIPYTFCMECVCLFVCVYVRSCVRACVRACVRVCVRACVMHPCCAINPNALETVVIFNILNVTVNDKSFISSLATNAAFYFSQKRRSDIADWSVKS